MKMQFKYTPVALAVAALVASPLAFANEDGPHHRNNHVSINKDLDYAVDVEISGDLDVVGTVVGESSSTSVVKDIQLNIDNDVENEIVDNDASADDNALRGASGNIGVNVTAGDNNQQANDAALSAIDAAFVFADAEIFADQTTVSNETSNYAVTNSASLGGNALRGASGNIGVNMSAGNSNQQKNDLAASVNASGTFAQSTVAGHQTAADNYTGNYGAFFTIRESIEVGLTGSLEGSTVAIGVGGYSGDTGGTYTGRHSGSSTGTADQIGNLYPDIWDNSPGDSPVHGTNIPGPVGHVDIDSAAQGAVDLNQDGGAFAFNTEAEYSGSQSGSYSGSEEGDLAFLEVGAVGLSGTFTGQVVNVETVFRPHVNDASLSGNALRGASGNIGVNVAAGTNNQQRNSLALSAALGNNPTPPGGGGEL